MTKSQPTLVNEIENWTRGVRYIKPKQKMFDYLSGNSNKCNPYAGTNNYHCLGFPSRSKHSACRPLGLPAPVFRSPGLRPSGNPLMKHCQAAVCLSTKCELRLLRLNLVRMWVTNRVVAPLVGKAWKAEPYKGGCPLGYGFGYFFHKK